MNRLRMSFFICIIVFAFNLSVIFYMTFAVNIPNLQAIITIQDKIILTQNSTISIMKEIIADEQRISDILREDISKISKSCVRSDGLWIDNRCIFLSDEVIDLSQHSISSVEGKK